MTEQATNGAADEQQPQFSLQRIYLRDLSFESPKSPGNLPPGMEPVHQPGP